LLVSTLKIFQGTHILGASRGRFCDSSAFLFFNGDVGTLPGSMRAKFEVRIFSHFETIRAYHLTPKNLRGYVTLATPPFREFVSGTMSGLAMVGACTPNLKSIALALSPAELLAFNSQILGGHVTLAMPPFTLF